MVASECGAKAIVSPCLQEFLHGPDVIGNSSLHRGRDAERLMYANEVEKRHVEIHSGPEMVQSLAETQAQARKAPQMSPHAQVGAFNVRGAYTSFVGIAADDDWDRCRN